MGVRGEDDSGRVYEGRKHEEEKSESVRVESVKGDGVVNGKMCIIWRRVGEKSEWYTGKNATYVQHMFNIC